MKRLQTIRSVAVVFVLSIAMEGEYFGELILYDELPAMSAGQFLLCFFSFVLVTFVQFLIIYSINSTLINKLESSMPWGSNQTFLKRSLIEFLATSIVAAIVTLPFTVYLDYSLLVPFWNIPTDGLLITVYYNLLYILVLNTLFVVSYEVFHLYVQRQKMQLNWEQSMRKNIITQFEALRYQVHPHYLFNSMESLMHLIETDRQKALEYAKNFIKVYRGVLEVSNTPTISLVREMEFVQSYLSIEEERLESRLTTSLDVKNEGLVPPFAIQTLVENAIKHNHATAENPLKIKIWSDPNYVFVQNTLNQKEIARSSTGKGLSNLLDRYKLISKLTPQFEKSETAYLAKIPILGNQTT